MIHERPWGRPLAGKLEKLEIDSVALRGNVLGDPSTRPVWVYLPPAYEKKPDDRLTTLYVIQGLTGQVDMWQNRTPFRPTMIERVDELFARGGAPPCVVVFVDCWTRLGGSQFVDSPGTGNYHTYLCEDVVSFIDTRYRTRPEAKHRGIAGKSSGGYGAMITPMLRPDLFGGLATHAGDALFEYCYLPEFPAVVRAMREHYHGSFERFWEDFHGRVSMSKASDETLLNIYCMAACYSANADGSVELPLDLHSGVVRPDVWRRWLDRDPVRMASVHATAIRGLRAIYIDCGNRDQYQLDIGARAFRDAVVAAGFSDPYFELFDGTHSAIEYRYPIGLSYLAKALQ